jgi:DnaJ like chaperone protein
MAKTSFLIKVKNGLYWLSKLIWTVIKFILKMLYFILNTMLKDDDWDRHQNNQDDDLNTGLLKGDLKRLKVVLALASAIIKVDGKTQAKELEFIQQRMEKSYSKTDVAFWMKQIESYLKVDFDINKLCKKADLNFRQSTKIQLLHFFAGIATKDGMLTNKELQLLKQITRKVGIPLRTLQSILALYNFITESQANEKRDRRSQQRESSSWELNKAYTILELIKSASNQEVKKAFRKLAKIHHPDKVSHMGIAFQKSAEKKFKQVLAAYEQVKVKRGMS